MQIKNSDWSIAFFEDLLNDKRFFKPPFSSMTPEEGSYSMALTIKYHELSDKDKEKICLVPVKDYAGIPEYFDDKPEFKRAYKKINIMADESKAIWKPGMWAIGLPMNLDQKDMYKIFKYYDNLIHNESKKNK